MSCCTNNENEYSKSELFDAAKAIAFAKDGCFVTNIHFNSDESMHYWNKNLYYEDGALLNEDYLLHYLISPLSPESIFVGKVWRIKYTPDEVDKDKLEKMHSEMKDYMLSASNKYKTYEEVIITKEDK